MNTLLSKVCKKTLLICLLNLKGLAIMMHAKDEATLTLKKSGPGVVYASDITLDHDVEICKS